MKFSNQFDMILKIQKNVNRAGDISQLHAPNSATVHLLAMWKCIPSTYTYAYSIHHLIAGRKFHQNIRSKHEKWQKKVKVMAGNIESRRHHTITQGKNNVK